MLMAFPESVNPNDLISSSYSSSFDMANFKLEPTKFLATCREDSVVNLVILHYRLFLDAFSAPRDPKSADFLSFHLEFCP